VRGCKTRSYTQFSSRGQTTPTPFLKWAGGKRWLAAHIENFLPPTFNRYFEPFLGSAAVFFHLRPRVATLSDINEDLINAYAQVRDNPSMIVEGLSALRVNGRTYLHIRKHKPRSDIGRAIRFIYLNKTAFNGLYRVNRNGDFNVPFAGNQGRSVFDDAELRSAAKLLRRCQVLSRDFEVAFSEAQAGDLIYCDPPYTVRHNNNGFIRYNESLFSWGDQRRLAAAARKAVERGIHVLVSNAQHESIRRLYRGFRVENLSRASCMAGDPGRRGRTSEYLFIGNP
jgi:DNA adenine methylase